MCDDTNYELIEGDNDSLPIVVHILSGKYEGVTVAYTKLIFSNDTGNPFVKFEFDIVGSEHDMEWTDEVFRDIEKTLVDILLEILDDVFV